MKTCGQSRRRGEPADRYGLRCSVPQPDVSPRSFLTPPQAPPFEPGPRCRRSRAGASADRLPAPRKKGPFPQGAILPESAFPLPGAGHRSSRDSESSTLAPHPPPGDRTSCFATIPFCPGDPRPQRGGSVRRESASRPAQTTDQRFFAANQPGRAAVIDSIGHFLHVAIRAIFTTTLNPPIDAMTQKAKLRADLRTTPRLPQVG
jgi:hypothetical protein